MTYLRKLFDWLMSVPGEDGRRDYEPDDCHDSIDPQLVTRIYGGGFEKGEWTSWND